VAVTVVFAVVGFLLSSQLSSVRTNSQAAAQSAAADTARLATLQDLYNKEVAKVEDLEKQLQQVTGDLDQYREQAAQGSSQGEALRAEVKKLEITAGMTDLVGPGVTVIMTDSSAVNTGTEEANYLIHDSDILSVVNELRSAGAEAISLNGERLLSNSEVRCAGSVVTVNGRRYAAPFVIFAIGDPVTLNDALCMRGGVVDVLGQWQIDVKVTASEELTVPKYQGTVEYRYAKAAGDAPADEGVG